MGKRTLHALTLGNYGGESPGSCGQFDLFLASLGFIIYVQARTAPTERLERFPEREEGIRE